MSAQYEGLKNWDEVRFAYHVARLGTLSAAAAHLGVHHATVIRHIDALEARLGCKLFQRNARGYVPTEAGAEMMRVAAATEDQLDHMATTLRGRSEAVSGDLIVTSLSGLSPQITPLLVEFQTIYPEIRLTYRTDERLLRLEYGEAHVALRAGPRPSHPDNVVQRIDTLPVALFAHRDYVARYGALKGLADAANHRFVVRLSPERRAPFNAWLGEQVPAHAMVYRPSEMRSEEDAIHAGAGIGFLSLWSGRSNPNLVQMMPTEARWDTELWLVTHVDLHRSAKVQALTGHLRTNLAARIRHYGETGVSRDADTPGMWETPATKT